MSDNCKNSYKIVRSVVDMYDSYISNYLDNDECYVSSDRRNRTAKLRNIQFACENARKYLDKEDMVRALQSMGHAQSILIDLSIFSKDRIKLHTDNIFNSFDSDFFKSRTCKVLEHQ
jgi:hypothetical protein